MAAPRCAAAARAAPAPQPCRDTTDPQANSMVYERICRGPVQKIYTNVKEQAGLRCRNDSHVEARPSTPANGLAQKGKLPEKTASVDHSPVAKKLGGRLASASRAALNCAVSVAWSLAGQANDPCAARATVDSLCALARVEALAKFK
jgi:hypothetical protein